MQVIVPSALTLVSSDADPSPYAAWDSGTAYVTGNVVSVSDITAHVRYEALASNTDRDPEATSGFWVLRGQVPLWDAITTWPAGAKVYLAAGASGHTEYTCKTANVNKSPDTNPTYWTNNGIISLWDSATTWVVGNQVFVIASYPDTEYEALTGNTNKYPPNNPTEWLELGVANKYKLLDNYTSTQTVGVNSITTIVKVEGRADVLALLNLTDVTTLTFEVMSGDSVVYSGTMPVTAEGFSTSWSAYFFTPPELAPSYMLTIPGYYSNVIVSVTFTGNTGVQMGCGHLLLGEAVFLGQTQYGIDLGIKDYSRKETDEFGETVLVERAYSKTMRARLELEQDALDFVSAKLTRVRATPCLYDANYPGGTQDALRIYGFYSEFTNVLEGWNNTICSLEITGLT